MSLVSLVEMDRWDSSATSIEWGPYKGSGDRISSLWLVIPHLQTLPSQALQEVAFPEQPAPGPPQLTSVFSRLAPTPHHTVWWLLKVIYH